MEQENQWHLEDLTAMGKPEGVSTKMIAFLARKGKLYVLVDAMSLQSGPFFCKLNSQPGIS